MRSSMITAMSSAGLRAAFATEGTGSSSLTERACGPRRPSATPKSTFAAGFGAGTPSGSADACRKTSPPSSPAMNPKPRSVSNHLTLPVGTVNPVRKKKTYWSQVTGRRPRKSPQSRKGSTTGRVGWEMTTTARARLEELRATTLARLAALESEHRAVVDASRDSNADDEHDPEGATIAFERAQVDALARDAADRLRSVELALGRLESGTYGRCEVCGAAIPEGRLEVRPTATTCVECAGR